MGSKLNMTGEKNICLGPHAGESLNDESYQFCLTTACGGPEFRTTMSEVEYKHVHSVVTRAIQESKNGKEKNKEGSKESTEKVQEPNGA